MSAPAWKDRVRGGILGALVGDALGVPVEFTDREKRDADPVAEMRGFGTWSQLPGTWSDDGALLLCLAEALAAGGGPAEAGALFVRWVEDGHWAARGEVFDIGGTTDHALRRIARGIPAELAGPADEHSNGNGSLMRILPVALRFAHAPAETLATEAMQHSRVTHGHPRAQLCCALYCLVAARMLRGEDADAALAAAIGEFRPLLAAHPAEEERFARVLAPGFARTAREEITGSGYVLHTLEASLWCLLRHADYRAAVLAAVNLGGDTDTTGCVTGGLAGLREGEAAIPAEWLAALPQVAGVRALADQLAAGIGE